MTDIRETIALRMEQRRNELNLTFDQVARRMTTTKPSIARYSKWEYGENSPKLEQLSEIASALEISPSYLCGFTNDRTSERAVVELFAQLPAAHMATPDGSTTMLESDKSLAFNEGVLRKKSLRAHQLILLKAHDNSMGTHVAAGDLVLVNRDECIPAELDIFALLVKNRVWFRWIRPELDGTFTVFAEDDSKYPPERIQSDNLRALCIIGRAVCISRFR